MISCQLVQIQVIFRVRMETGRFEQLVIFYSVASLVWTQNQIAVDQNWPQQSFMVTVSEYYLSRQIYCISRTGATCAKCKVKH